MLEKKILSSFWTLLNYISDLVGRWGWAQPRKYRCTLLVITGHISWSQVRLLFLKPSSRTSNKASQWQASADHTPCRRTMLWSVLQLSAQGWILLTVTTSIPQTHVVFFKPSHQKDWFPWAQGHPIHCIQAPFQTVALLQLFGWRRVLVCLFGCFFLLSCPNYAARHQLQAKPQTGRGGRVLPNVLQKTGKHPRPCPRVQVLIR